MLKELTLLTAKRGVTRQNEIDDAVYYDLSKQLRSQKYKTKPCALLIKSVENNPRHIKELTVEFNNNRMSGMTRSPTSQLTNLYLSYFFSKQLLRALKVTIMLISLPGSNDSSLGSTVKRSFQSVNLKPISRGRSPELRSGMCLVCFSLAVKCIGWNRQIVDHYSTDDRVTNKQNNKVIYFLV